MKISVPLEAFRAAIKDAVRVASAKGTIPILQCVRLRCDGGPLHIIPTDLDTSIDIEVSGGLVNGTADVCADAKALADFAAAARGATIEMEEVKDALRVSSGKARVGLSTLPSSDFPTSEAPDGLTPVSADTIAGAIRFASVAASTEEARYYLNGIFATPDADGSTIMVATDGHRMHVARLRAQPLPGSGGIIPNRALPLIAGMLAKQTDARMLINEDRWAVAVPGRTAWGKMVAGSFPAWERLLPKDAREAWKADPAAVTTAIRQAMAGSSDLSSMMVMRGEGETVVAAAAKPSGPVHEAGEAEVEAEASGLEWRSGINSRYLTDTLTALPSDVRARLSLSELDKAAALFFLEPETQAEGLDLSALVLGMRA